MSIQAQIHKRIKGKGRGSVFTPKDFLDLGSRAAVDQSLARMAKSDTIRRLSRGVYDFPTKHPRLGTLTPSADAVARAVVGQNALQQSGAYAANALGLSTQVPARSLYFTNGPQRNVQIGNMMIRVRRRSAKNLVGAGTEAGKVYQALRHLGRSRVDAGVINDLRNRVPRDIRQQFHSDLKKHPHLVPDWLISVSEQLVAIDA